MHFKAFYLFSKKGKETSKKALKRIYSKLTEDIAAGDNKICSAFIVGGRYSGALNMLQYDPTLVNKGNLEIYGENGYASLKEVQAKHMSVQKKLFPQAKQPIFYRDSYVNNPCGDDVLLINKDILTAMRRENIPIINTTKMLFGKNMIGRKWVINLDCYK